MALTDSLACYFPMWEPSGNTICAHRGFVGTETSGTIASGAGKPQLGRVFASADTEYFEVADNSGISGSNNDLTIAFWFYPTSVTGTQVLAHKGWQGANDVNREWVIYLSGANLFWTPQRSTTFADTAVGGVTINTWHFVVSSLRTSDGLRSNRFNNGTAVTGTTAGLIGGVNDGTRTMQFGASTNQALYYSGTICEFGMWKRLLTTDEQTYLYNSGAGRTYPFGEFIVPQVRIF